MNGQIIDFLHLRLKDKLGKRVTHCLWKQSSTSQSIFPIEIVQMYLIFVIRSDKHPGNKFLLNSDLKIVMMLEFEPLISKRFSQSLEQFVKQNQKIV